MRQGSHRVYLHRSTSVQCLLEKRELAFSQRKAKIHDIAIVRICRLSHDITWVGNTHTDAVVGSIFRTWRNNNRAENRRS